jgi:hypothetical protein
MKFECERCFYETDKKSSYKNHLSRKIPCDDLSKCRIKPIDLLKALEKDTTEYEFKCSLCDHKFQTNSGKYKHEVKCKLLTENKKLKEALEKQEQQFNISLKNLENEFKDLKNIILNQNIQHIENNQNINQHFKQNNITINVFGIENLSHITPEFILKCLNKAVVGKYVFNSNNPENNNSYKL